MKLNVGATVDEILKHAIWYKNGKSQIQKVLSLIIKLKFSILILKTIELTRQYPKVI